MKVGYVPIYVAIGEFLEDFDLIEVEIDENLLKKWASDAVAMISTNEQLIHKIALIDAYNYKAKLPEDFSKLCEISYRLEIPENCGTRSQQITKFVQSTTEGCDLEIAIKCPKCHKTGCTGCGQNSVVVDVDRIWEMANSHYYYPTRFMSPNGVQSFGRGEYPTSIYSDYFKLMRPASSDWFQLDKHIPDCVNAHCTACEETYMISHPNIEVSFKKGEVLFAYLAKPADEDGNPLIPDHHDAIEAVVNHIVYKWARKEWNKDKKDQALARWYKDAKLERDESIGRAKSVLQIPNAADWSEWLRGNRYYKINNALDNLYQHGVPLVSKFGPNNKYKN